MDCAPRLAGVVALLLAVQQPTHSHKKMGNAANRVAHSRMII